MPSSATATTVASPTAWTPTDPEATSLDRLVAAMGSRCLPVEWSTVVDDEGVRSLAFVACPELIHSVYIGSFVQRPDGHWQAHDCGDCGPFASARTLPLLAARVGPVWAGRRLAQ